MRQHILWSPLEYDLLPFRYALWQELVSFEPTLAFLRGPIVNLFPELHQSLQSLIVLSVGITFAPDRRDSSFDVLSVLSLRQIHGPPSVLFVSEVVALLVQFPWFVERDRSLGMGVGGLHRSTYLSFRAGGGTLVTVDSLIVIRVAGIFIAGGRVLPFALLACDFLLFLEYG